MASTGAARSSMLRAAQLLHAQLNIGSQSFRGAWAGAQGAQLRTIFSTRLVAAATEGGASAGIPVPPEAKRGGFTMFQGILALGVTGGLAYAWTLFNSKMPQPGSLNTAPTPVPALSKVGDYDAVRKAIADVMDADNYDDGSYGPVLVRLAWHASGTYDKASNTGGSDGATMRFPTEANDPGNRGLQVARQLLEPVKAKFPWISYADLWTLAGCVAVEEMGGPHVPWRPGRSDAPSESFCPPNGRLPDASQGAAHVRAVFGRMGFNDQEMVALSGAHTLGRCHGDRSHYEGPWTNAPTTFSNLYFQELMNKHWQKKKWEGPVQYEDKETKKLMMLPTDMVMLWDRGFKKYTQQYAKDEDKFFQDFAAAFQKLLELGVPFPEGVKAT